MQKHSSKKVHQEPHSDRIWTRWLNSSIFNPILLAIIFVAGQGLHAQYSASLSGTVQDDSGAVIPGATIVITNLETAQKQTQSSNATGF